MGAGKTTIGRHLSCALGLPFVDSDREIEARTGATIPLIFELEGEAGFRAREKATLDELTQRTGIVLATGGGIVLDPDNRQVLRERGRVIYLRAPLEVLVQRTARDRNRPLLNNTDPRAKLRLLLEQRDPLYHEVADTVVDTGHRNIQAVVREVLTRLQDSQPGLVSFEPCDDADDDHENLPS